MEDPFDELIKEILKMMKRMQENMERELKEFLGEDFDIKELDELVPGAGTPSGVEIRGPMIYGYYMTIGPDGKPTIRRFGNVVGGDKEIEEVEESPEREPASELMEFRDEYIAIVEMPGVSRSEIKVRVRGGKLEVEGGPYRTSIALPGPVEPKEIRATYKNGILEVRLKKRGADIHR